MKVSEVLQLDTIVDILMLALAETPPPHLAVRSLGRSACVCVAWRRGNADNYPCEPSTTTLHVPHSLEKLLAAGRAVALNFNSPTLRRFLDGISREDCGTDLEQPGCINGSWTSNRVVCVQIMAGGGEERLQAAY